MNRKVLDALTTLQQGEKSIYLPVDTIVQEVTLGMGETDDSASVEKGVRRSLASLTRHGLLERSGNSYTRHQLPVRSSSYYNTVGYRRFRRRGSFKEFTSTAIEHQDAKSWGVHRVWNEQGQEVQIGRCYVHLVSSSRRYLLQNL